jgi:hypothetical protein
MKHLGAEFAAPSERAHGTWPKTYVGYFEARSADGWSWNRPACWTIP